MYVLQWDNVEESILNEVIIFILNDIRTLYKTGQLKILDNDNQVIFDVLASEQKQFIITVNDEIDKNVVINERKMCILSNSNLIVIKYKDERKLESINYQIKTIKNLNQKYLETIALLQENKDVSGQQKSIERSACAYPMIQKTKGIIQQPMNLKEYSLEEIKTHNNEKSAWIVLEGKVYDITLYIKQHPGGVQQILRGVGKDATKLFLEIHPWVNGCYILQHFQIGYIMN